MRIYIFLGLAFLFGSCSVNKDIIGKYSSNKHSNRFEFKKDSTFAYEYLSFHLLKYSEGKWMNLTKNKIVITSDIKSTIIPLTVEELESNNLKSKNALSLHINIEDGKNLSEYMCGIYINDVFYNTLRCDSVSYLPISIPIDSCYFYITKEPDNLTTAVSPPVYTSKYYTKAEESNNLNITIDFNESFFYYQSFNESVVKIKKKSIQFYDTNTKKWVKVPKVSDESNIFSSFRNTRK
jgi:hypothetical protein